MSKNGLSRSISKIADKLPYISFLSVFLVIKAVSINGRVAKKTLCERLSKDVERGIRSEDVIEKSIARMPMYQALNTIKIDSNAKTAAMIANEIKQL